MIEINTLMDKYSFDENTGTIYKNGVIIPSSLCEPIYSSFSDDEEPQFAGILLKNKNSIVSLTGAINPVVDINTL